ncbi:hypothetical protein [Sphaerotilus sp.]|uniref:hypothetical protein n=1 Tax=Sphaerotilus sp. TaxID=2093942 RepID=UPI0034E2422C
MGIESASAVHAHTEAEAKAVGSACRHAMRAIEDCYTLNPKAEKAAVYAGWREMDEYMRENKLEGVAPTEPRPASPGAKPKVAKEDPPDEEILDDGKKPQKAAAAAAGHAAKPTH